MMNPCPFCRAPAYQEDGAPSDCWRCGATGPHDVIGGLEPHEAWMLVSEYVEDRRREVEFSRAFHLQVAGRIQDKAIPEEENPYPCTKCKRVCWLVGSPTPGFLCPLCFAKDYQSDASTPNWLRSLKNKKPRSSSRRGIEL